MLNISKIQWPIFPLSDSIPILKEGNVRLVEQADESLKILDDLNYTGNLGMRRLQSSASSDRKLFPLSKPIFRFEDLIRYKKSSRFIDNSGYIFNYTKSVYYPLTYHKIVKFIETKNGYAVEVKKFHCRFFLTVEPKLEWKYAGIIRVGRGFLLYDLAETKLADTRRML